MPWVLVWDGLVGFRMLVHLLFPLCIGFPLFSGHAGIKLVILLPQTPECWHYRCVPLCLLEQTHELSQVKGTITQGGP